MKKAKEILEKLNQMPNSQCVPTKAMKKELNDFYEKIINEKENKIMSNTGNSGKSFTEALKKQTTKFNNWTSVCTAILNAKKSLSDAITTIKELDDSPVYLQKSVDTFEVDLAKEGIDVSEWEDDVKPVKAIMSVVTKDKDESFAVEIGNMVMLMEDGTFRTRE